MDRASKTERNRLMRDRCVEKLLSLAALAERASGWPLVLRFLVLWAIRPGEAAARQFAIHMLQAFGSLHDHPCLFETHAIGHGGNSRTDALCLAQSLRNLADVMAMLPVEPDYFIQRAGEAAGFDAYNCPPPALAGVAERITTLVQASLATIFLKVDALLAGQSQLRLDSS